MKRQWEISTGKANAYSGEAEARVTLGRNTFYLNGKAFEALGAPGAVEMRFEGNERIIGLRPVDPAARNAFASGSTGARVITNESRRRRFAGIFGSTHGGRCCLTSQRSTTTA